MKKRYVKNRDTEIPKENLEMQLRSAATFTQKKFAQ
jgi:hypothetical protein